MNRENTDSNETQSKSPNPLKWRLKYGQRPPRKSEADLKRDQDEIESFLQNREVTTIPANASSRTPRASQNDKSLMSKFAKKHLR